MKKTLLSLFAIGFSVVAVAQTNGRIFKPGHTINSNEVVIKPQSITAGTSAITCDTLSTITTTALGVGAASSDTATPGCSPNAGYVYGTNCYGDLEKANFFAASMYSVMSTPQITGVIVAFYNNLTEGTGGAPTGTVGLNIYGGTAATAAPGAALGSTVATLAQITAAHTTTNTIFFYTFDFATPINAPVSGGFYASVAVPTTPGDTAALVNQASAPVNLAWEMWSDLSWHSISSAWGTNGNLLILPKICGTTTTGISENLGLSKNVTVMPNPTTGLVNVVVTLATKENLTISISNALGQVVMSNNYNSIYNDLISLDLSGQNNGVYFVTVSNGKDKMVQKLVLNK